MNYTPAKAGGFWEHKPCVKSKQISHREFVNLPRLVPNLLI